jgi:HlyD family secretion protein
MKKALLTLLVIAMIGGSVYAYYRYKQTGPKASVNTAAVTHGDVVDTVGATGTLQAVKTVQVGTQVSGTIESLYADFNSLVKKGQVLARLDPSLFQTQIEQARANLIRSQADLERLRVSLDDAKTKLARARELSNRQLLPKSELDTAEVNVRAAEAQLRSSEAQVTQAQASLNQNEVNLAHTVIEAPIDGLVISRSVDVGQTVAASMQAPTLYILAADLTKMQVVANLDESDVGRIRPGQRVTFRVDAYPNEQFVGAVSQVRLEPKVQQNVVTYATVIDVPNNELKLKPGMTANVNVEIARSTNVLRIPNSALRFRPTNDMYTALGLPVPEQGRGGDFARRGGPGAADAPATPHADGEAGSATAGSPAARSGAPAGGRGASANATAAGGGGRGGNSFAGQANGLPPEQRERMLQQMRQSGQDPSSARGERRRGQPAATAEAPAAKAKTNGNATTIDALFGPLPRTESMGRVFQYVDKQLKPVRVRLGISDGQNTELIEGDLQAGAEVVTNIATAAATRPAANQAFPFGPQGGGGRGGGGFGPGGGFGGPGGGGGGNRGGGR